MAVTSLKRSGLTSLIKYDRFTAGNESDFTLIASQTVGSGGASSITFSNIPQGYRHLQLRGMVADQRTGFSGSQILFRYNGDTSANYTEHQLSGNGSSASSFGAGNISNNVAGMGDADAFGVLVIDFLDYSQTNKNKTMRALSGADKNSAGFVRFDSGLWMSTNAISSITFLPLVGNFRQHSTLSLYGIR